jgi:hypothetical protein
LLARLPKSCLNNVPPTGSVTVGLPPAASGTVKYTPPVAKLLKKIDPFPDD